MKYTFAVRQRLGIILPMVALCLIPLIACLALAIDLGLLIILRTQCQNAADAGTLVGSRMLNNQAAQNNYPAAAAAATNVALQNYLLNQPITGANILLLDGGSYNYDPAAQRFIPGFPFGGPNYAAMRMQVRTDPTNQPSFFARIFNVTNLNTMAEAQAVHRPRDIALVLDYSISMKFGTTTSWPSGWGGSTNIINGLINPDSVFPKFGHYSSFGPNTINCPNTSPPFAYVMPSGEVNTASNTTIPTEGGDPIVRDFWTYDRNGSYVMAFHNSALPSPYNWRLNPWRAPMPAPSNFQDQSDTVPAPYVGDKAPSQGAGDGINYFSGIAPWAKTAAEFVGYNPGTVDGSTNDANFETIGYDVTGRPFVGYSMGPKYWGKTFFIWPPDPRAPQGQPVNNLVDPNAIELPTYTAGDWRRRFFGTNDNTKLFNNSANQAILQNPGPYNVNYQAIMAWIKTGPQTLPPNLRSGRVVYYTHIPDDVVPNGGSSNGDIDRLFWKRYIDYVIGINNDARTSLAGLQTSSWGTMKLTAPSGLFADYLGNTPYMHYNDNVARPRLHFWFGPMSMMDFISNQSNGGNGGNALPGTCHEAQCWQLKAGVQSAIEDIKNNHPNDQIGMAYFAARSQYGTPRVGMGQRYNRMKNTLWYPYNFSAGGLFDSAFPLPTPSATIATTPTGYSAITSSQEFRPYNPGDLAKWPVNTVIPNANGSTDPETGLVVAYNMLSSGNNYGGRVGATKIVLFETDGVPNTVCNKDIPENGSSITTPPFFYYNTPTSFAGAVDVAAAGRAANIAHRIANVTDPYSYSRGRSRAYVHAIGFGDIVTPNTGNAARDARRLKVITLLRDVQVAGNTSPAGQTTTQFETSEPYKLIYGPFDQRILNLRNSFERILQSGVQVNLIK